MATLLSLRTLSISFNCSHSAEGTRLRKALKISTPAANFSGGPCGVTDKDTAVKSTRDGKSAEIGRH
jgi:hypothetical protein